METARDKTGGINEDPNQLGVQLGGTFYTQAVPRQRGESTQVLTQCQQCRGYCLRTVIVNSVLGTVEFNG